MYNGEFYKGYTPGPFDVMNYVGSWAPTFTAWNRWLMDWVTDNEVKCLDKGNVDIELKLTDVNLVTGTKAAVVRLSSTKVLVVESRKNNKFDFLGPNEGLFVYTVDMNIKSGEGAVRAISDLNQFTTQAHTTEINDVNRFLTGTLRTNEYLVHDGLFIGNVSSSQTTDTVRIASGSIALELESKAAKEKAIADALFERLKSESKIGLDLLVGGDCQPTGTIATLQVLEGGSWRDLTYATEWISSNTCVNFPRESTAIWNPVVINSLSSYVRYRWKYQKLNQWWTASYSSIYMSPQTKADAEAEAKAKAEAEAKAAAELKAKQEAEAKAKAEAEAEAEAKAKAEAEAKAAAELKAKQEAEAKAKAEAAQKKSTITCTKGKKVKKVTAVNPKCPKGYKKK
jgi:hypothetical protein